MEYGTLGRTGLRVSGIGYGGAVLGIPHYLAPEDPTTDASTQARLVESIERAVDLGINYFDTAPGYGDGTSERIYGRVLPQYRDQVLRNSI